MAACHRACDSLPLDRTAVGKSCYKEHIPRQHDIHAGWHVEAHRSSVRLSAFLLFDKVRAKIAPAKLAAARSSDVGLRPPNLWLNGGITPAELWGL